MLVGAIVHVPLPLYIVIPYFDTGSLKRAMIDFYR